MLLEDTLDLFESTLELLSDDKWHNVKDLARNLNQKESTVREVLDFFEKYGFVHLDKEKKRALINPQIKNLKTTDE